MGVLSQPATPKPAGTYLPVIENEIAAAELGRIVSLFSQVEADMAVVMQQLLGNPAHRAGAAIQRTVRAPRAKLDLMLELAKEVDVNFDGALSARQLVEWFERINKTRNDYVHGLWWTRTGTGGAENYLAPIGEYFPQARLVEPGELKSFFEELNSLWFQLKGFKVMSRDARFLPEFP
jgi:hypothetical protein